MSHSKRILLPIVLILTISLDAPGARAQSASEKDTQKIQIQLAEIKAMKSGGPDTDVFIKAVEWILRHNEFFKPDYAKQTLKVIRLGRERLTTIDSKPWFNQVGRRIYGYRSKVDGSVQPYAITLPPGVDPEDGKRWPLHVVLHGRAGTMNEVNFIHRHEGKSLPKGQDWIQLDVFGRTNNAYRWSGETDVFEAMRDVKRRFRIDEERITLHGFSMGGAGAWHLGVHYPSQWSSVGPGAGFVDFYRYQKQKEERPVWQHKTLGIYDSIDYALNAFNVPICTYGGEKDAQLAAGKSMTEAAKKLGVDIKLLIGPNMGHKFDPASRKTFMDFHIERSKSGRLKGRKRREIRFTTRTLKYNKCGWLTVLETTKQYSPTVIHGLINDEGNLSIDTKNVSAFMVDRGISGQVTIDGDGPFELESAADGLLPDVYYEKANDGWKLLSYQDSRSFDSNTGGHKRKNLQGPIDDAFTGSFVCITPTGTALSEKHEDWTKWTLGRFQSEYDKWLRAEVPLMSDKDALKELASEDSELKRSHLILFGDPGSNAVMARVISKLPVEWNGDKFTVNDTQYDADSHGLSMIFPNPLNPSRYVVINSGHTMHEKDFKASNSWLFPRLGDIAVQSFSKTKDGYDEKIEWAEIFNGGWKLPSTEK